MPETPTARIVDMPPAVIDEVFENAKHQQEWVLALFRIVYPDFDKIQSIDGWPSCSKELWDYVCSKAMSFDRKHHPDCLAGGAWLNYGFSVSPEVTGWQVVPAPVTYNNAN